MRVWIDIRPAGHPGIGIGVYTTQLVEHLLQDAGTTYVLDYASLRGRDLVGLPHDRVRWGGIVRYLTGKAWERGLRVPALEAFAGNLDIAHGTNYWCPPTKRAKRIATVHDLTALTHPEWHTPEARRLGQQLAQTLPQMDRLITVSHSTRNDLIEHVGVDPARVDVIPLAPSPIFVRPSDEVAERALERYGLNGVSFVLHVGSLEPRKNLVRLVNAFARAAPASHKLVFAAAAGWTNAEFYAAIDRHDLRDRVQFTGYVASHDLPALYSRAALVAYPSLYEGFGLPVIEALACGAPVLSSSVSSIPEVAGDAAMLVDPTDDEAIADGIRLLLHDESERAALREKGPARAEQFTWNLAAARTLESYRKATG